MKTKYGFVTLDFLNREHYVKGKSLHDMARENNIPKGTIYCLAKARGFRGRGRSETNKLLFSKGLTKDVLYREYVEKNKTMQEIADAFSYCRAGVYKLLKKYNLNIKTEKGNYYKVWNKGLTKKGDKRVAKYIKNRIKTVKRRASKDSNYLKEWHDKCRKALKKANKLINRTPNNKEKKLSLVLNSLLPKEYKFVGDGKIWIDKFNPDFINTNGQKKIIELFGDYWHNLPDYIERDKRRIKAYKKYGYKTLIIWEKELKDLSTVKRKILNFNKGS